MNLIKLMLKHLTLKMCVFKARVTENINTILSGELGKDENQIFGTLKHYIILSASV